MSGHEEGLRLHQGWQGPTWAEKLGERLPDTQDVAALQATAWG